MSGVTNPLEMSDEEFNNLVGPQAITGDPAPNVDPTPPTEGPIDEAAATPEAGAATPSGVVEGVVDGTGDEANTPAPADNVADPVPAPTEADAAPVPEGDVPAPGSETADLPTAEEAQDFYKKIMAPFKANGKTIELRSPEEAIGLIQMGANYTRKMQELAPHRKTLLMLQNNNLLDHDKLSFLIDLEKGDPEAVKKFVKDRGIDPMDIDTSTDPAYLGGNHRVSDEEAVFRSTLEDLRSTPEGAETLVEVNNRWDNTSKELLWKNPEILPAIQEQRVSGVYDAIVAEMDRQQTLGKLPATIPFLEAYRIVGDQLVAAHSGQTPNTVIAPATPAPTVLATRVAAPKSSISNSDQASAAAPTRRTAPQAQVFENPLAMSDDDFLKKMANRV